MAVEDSISAQGRELSGRITNGHIEGVRRHLDNGWPIDAPVNTAGSALHHAAQMGETRICKLLIEHGADVNLQRVFDPDGDPKFGYSPLHGAAQYGHAEVVELLLQRGANPNAVAFNGRRPLHLAACNEGYYHGWVDVIKMLLAAGADPNVFVDKAPDPRHWSCAPAYENKAEHKNANWYYTPLHLALETSGKLKADPNDSYNGHKAVESLVAAGADPFVLPEGAPKFYLTPIQTAVKYGQAADLMLLLALEGVDLGARSLAGRSLVQLAAARPENKAVIMAAKTAKLVEGSMASEAAQSTEVQPVKSRKGMSPL